MKASHYNRIFQAADGTWLAYNAWSTALAVINVEDLPFIQALLERPDGVPVDTDAKRDLREALIRGRFLLEDDEDEVASLKVDMFRDRFRTDLLGLTIAPTLDCNFRCDYCYEDHLRVTMSRTVQQALLRWVEERVKTIERLHVTWFGGEPMIPSAFPVVESLSSAFQDLARSRGFKYEAELVTNGYFLTREKTENLVALGVGKIQVTLDGPAEIHDQRRLLAGGQGTFGKILENLKATVDLVPIQLRINVDRRNASGTLDLMELLVREGIADKLIPHVAQVTTDDTACGNIAESCFSSEEFARSTVEIFREAARRNLPLSRYPFRIRGAFCSADRVNSFVIAPSGAIFKCWHEVTAKPDRAIGHLLDGVHPYHKANENRWLAWNPLEKEECPSCSVLPLCHGGCPDVAMKRSASPRGACEESKYNLEPLLEIMHVHRPSRRSGEPSRGGMGAGS